VARLVQKALLVLTTLAVLAATMPGVAGAAAKKESTSPSPNIVNSGGVIDTTADVNNDIRYFGAKGAAATYGQTVTVPEGYPVLNSFTFLMNLPSTVKFRGEVYAWDGQKATGKNLFESKTKKTAGSGSNEPITFDTGGKKLNPGEQYVLFATTSKAPSGSGNGTWGFVDPGTYSDGQFVYDGNTKFKQLTRKPWVGAASFPDSDLGFKAVFASQP
jgi:hypothetical protein